MRLHRVLILSAVAVAGLGTTLTIAQGRAAAQMAAAARDFLAALPADQRAQASFAFDDAERTNWHFVPLARKGVPLKALDDKGRAAAHALLRTGVSQRGYAKAQDIMALENVLRAIEGRDTRDPGLYYVSVFGTPGSGTWGWRFEGHHVSLNYTVADGRPVAFAPSFFGANPAVVREGGTVGARALPEEESAGRAVVLGLGEGRRQKAVIAATAPNDILSFDRPQTGPIGDDGVSSGEMTAGEKALLKALLDAYLGRMPQDVADDRRARLNEAGFDKITFAWAGETEPGKPHYYRVQGPTFLIEYDNTQNGGNHIHSVWRDFAGDFGRDLLREHYLEAHAAAR